MGITVFASLAVLCLLTFPVIFRRFHLLELILLWGIIVFVESNYIWLAGLNGKFIRVGGDPGAIISYTVICKIIVPVIVFHAMCIDMRVKRVSLRLLCLVSLLFVLMGIERLAVRLKVIHFSGEWEIGWSYLYWGLLIIVIAAAWRGIRKIAKREVVL